MRTQEKLNLLKESEQDFEWYPTTDEMICSVFRCCGKISSVLDIGAGDGRVLEKLDRLCFARDGEGEQFISRLDKYAIEISGIHLENMPYDVSVIGTDFKRQTLIDKKVDVVFCNPPYSEFENWSIKIIKEANAETVFLVIPSRWTESKLIELAIKQRQATSQIIWSGDFKAADRPARAKVDIIKISLGTKDSYTYKRTGTDPFDVWFEEYFSGFKQLEEREEEESDDLPKPENRLVEGRNLIDRLSELYDNEMKMLLENYKTLSELDTSLLNEIGISVKEIRKALKQKIEGLKNKYWQELFNKLDKITNRLTSSSRKSMLDKLSAKCNIDFSPENAYAVVLWVIKNANQYFDRQLIEVFKELSEPECVKNYKSNLKTWEKDEWRYKKEHTHYMLEYRIISSRYRAIVENESWYKYDSKNGLYNDCHDFINDIFTIANNLGFENGATASTRQWVSNKQQEFYYSGNKILAQVRAFKNGNIHLKLDQEFIKTLNIEASRLLGWIKTPEEAACEMGLDIEYVKEKFKSNRLFGLGEGRKLLMAG